MRPLPTSEWGTLKRIATDVAGRGRAGLVLRALEDRTWVDTTEDRAALYFDEETLRIDKLVYSKRRCPFVLIHEFGHAYHCFYWPVLSGLMEPPCDEAEAVAYLFEMELREVAWRHYTYNPPMPHLSYLATSTWKLRSSRLKEFRRENPEPFDILHRVLQTPVKDFHSLVEAIVNGS